MTRKPIRIFAVVLATLLVTASGPAWASHKPNNEVLFGGAISQTGQYAEPAGRQVNAIKQWVEEVNGRGGILGHKIALRLLDDKSDTQTSIKLYEKLITEDKVDVLLAPYSSGITEAVANVNERYKMPFVAYGASSTPIWEKGRKYIFNIVAVAEDYQKGAIHLAKQIGVKSIAIIGQDSLFPRQAAKGAKEHARQVGIEVVLEENYPVKQTDFTALLQKIQAAGAEAIISNSYFADSAAQLRQMRELNLNFKLYSSTIGPSLPNFPEQVGGVALAPVGRHEAHAVEHQATEARVVLGQVVERGRRQQRRADRTLVPAIEVGRAFDLEGERHFCQPRVEARGRRIRCEAVQLAQQSVHRMRRARTMGPRRSLALRRGLAVVRRRRAIRRRGWR